MTDEPEYRDIRDLVGTATRPDILGAVFHHWRGRREVEGNSEISTAASAHDGDMLGHVTARTPKGTEVRTVIKHVTKLLKKHWPNTRIVWLRDSHYGRVEAME
jgi:hypothetical protein